MLFQHYLKFITLKPIWRRKKNELEDVSKSSTVVAIYQAGWDGCKKHFFFLEILSQSKFSLCVIGARRHKLRAICPGWRKSPTAGVGMRLYGLESSIIMTPSHIIEREPSLSSIWQTGRYADASRKYIKRPTNIWDNNISEGQNELEGLFSCQWGRKV